MGKKEQKIIKTINKMFDRLEKGQSCFKEREIQNDEWCIFFTDKQLKQVFNLTDREIENLHSKALTKK